MQQVLAIAILLGAWTTALAETRVAIRLGMPSIELNGVPQLWDSAPSADRVMPGMKLEPAVAYQWIVSPGEEFHGKITVPAGTGGNRAALTVWNWNRVAIHQAWLEVPCEEPVCFQVDGRGVYLLTVDLFEDKTLTARLPRSFGVLPSNADKRALWRKSEFWIGTCCFPGRQHWRSDFGPGHPSGLTEKESADLDAELSKRLGLTVARPDIQASWPVETEPINFSKADVGIAAWTDREFELGLQLGGLGHPWSVKPAYAHVPDPIWRYPMREDVLRTYVGQCLDRWGRFAKYVELNNETDNTDFWRGTPQEYLDHARVIKEEVRKRFPELPLANAGYTFFLPKSTALFARELNGELQLGAYHSHGTVEMLRQAITMMELTVYAAGWENPRIINTEMGYAAWRLDVERNMAATAIQKLLCCWAHGNQGALLYCSRDIVGPRGTDGDWGYLDYDMCPRFMYGAVGAFVDQYAGARFERIHQETEGLYAYEFATESGRLVALFAPNEKERDVVITSDATTAQEVDVMGNSTAATDAKTVTAKIGFYPMVVRLSGATAVQSVK